MADDYKIIAPELCKRYARALFALANDNGVLNKVKEDMQSFLSAYKESKELRFCASCVIYSRTELASSVGKISNLIGNNKFTKNFLCLLASKRRLWLFPHLHAEFIKLCNNADNLRKVYIETPKCLTEEQKSRLTKILVKTLGSDVIVEETTNSNMLGGMIVKVENKMVDASLNSRISSVAQILERSCYEI